jgi:hypothetical protein
VSATIPVGTSNTTMPAVKKAFAVNASRFESPASSRKIVLMPQISDAARVFPNIKARYVPWIERGVGSLRVTQEPTYRAGRAVPRPASTLHPPRVVAQLAERGTSVNAV